MALFDRVWRDGLPLVLATAAGRRADRCQLPDWSTDPRLLLAGLTDQAAANQLGLSMRTVQRPGPGPDGSVEARHPSSWGFHAPAGGCSELWFQA